MRRWPTILGTLAALAPATVAPVHAQEAGKPSAFVAVHGRRALVMGYPETGLEVWAYPLELLDGCPDVGAPAAAGPRAGRSRSWPWRSADPAIAERRGGARESIGEFAVMENIKDSRGPVVTPVYDYKTIDGDYMLAPVPLAYAHRFGAARFAAESGVDARSALDSLPTDDLRFSALSLDAAGRPIPVMNTDVGFDLLLSSPAPKALSQIVDNVMRPCPRA